MTRAYAAVGAVAVLTVAILAGCRVVNKIDTDPLESTISALPGVTEAWVSFDDHELDSITTLNAQMARAETRQITDVVQAVADARTSGSADYLQRLRITVSDSPTVTILRDASAIDPSEIVADTQRLRAFATTVAAASPQTQIDLDPDKQLTVRTLTTPIPETLVAVRNRLTDSATRVVLLPADTNAPDWSVTLPLPPAQQHRIEQQIATLPAQLDSIDVQDSTITALRVLVDGPTARRDLAEVISIVGAGPDNPLWLTWHIEPRDDLTQQYDGSVDVGGCSYPDSRLEQHPDKYLSAEEIDLQNGLRHQFDTCPR
ncbi:hypothetical protein ACNQR7_30995 [Mycolicibacterium senegalense]|uniref:hypothetical protein n=1 Tax=Mycolicibacterium senegalense TaxID=1796 RepID=UPI003AB0A51F